MEHAPALLCIVATGALMVSEVRDAPRVRAVSKTVAAGSFIAYAFTMDAWSAGAPGRWVIAALVLCMIGDLCLLSREKTPFLAGIGAFLLGHVAYIGAFLSLGVSVVGTAVAAVVIALIAAFVWRWVGPHAGNLRAAVAAYIVVISAMVTMAFGSTWMSASPGRIALLVGAIGFFASDLCVARDRFVAPGPQNRMVGLPLYFGSQLVFAAAIASAAP